MKKLLSLITLFALGAFSALTSWGAEVTLTDANALNDILANPGKYAGDGNTYKPSSSSSVKGSWLTLPKVTTKYTVTLSVLDDRTISLVVSGSGSITSASGVYPNITADVPAGTKIKWLFVHDCGYSFAA